MTEFVYVSESSRVTMLDVAHDVIVIPVNRMGSAVAGLAGAYAKKFPQGFGIYQLICRDKRPHPGDVHVPDESHDILPHLPFFMFTKDHWSEPSRIEWIEEGFKQLHDELKLRPWIRDVGLPKVGCGLGLLRWEDVHPLMVKHLDGVKQIVHVYGSNTLRVSQGTISRIGTE